MPHQRMTPAEAADHLHLAPGELQAMIERRSVPCERIAGRIVFRRDELECWYRRRLLEMPSEALSRYLKEGSRLKGQAMSGAPLLPACLTGDRVHPALACRTAPSLLRTMAELAVDTGLVVYPDELLASLQAREALATTALPDGLALLHPLRHDPYLFETSFVLMGRTIQPVPFNAPDGGRTRLFFLLCCADHRLHLQVMARLCLAVTIPETLDLLMSCDDPHALCEVLLKAEENVLRGL